MEMNSSKTVKDTYQGVTRAGDQLADRAEKVIDKAKTSAHQLIDRAEGLDLAARYDAIKEGASEGYQSAVSTVKKYPLYALGGAAALGLFAGLWFARRRD